MRTRSAVLLLVLATALPRLLALLHERGAILASFTDKGDNFAQTYLATGTYGFIPGHPSAYTQPLYVAGRKTFAGDILELCGADNAAQVDGWPQYSIEALLANPPDVVLHPDKSVPHAQVVALFVNSPKKPEVVAVDENVFSRPGPRIVEAARRLNAILDAHE